MDPVTAIGLASSVVQLIQFGFSLTSQANRIYKSAEGASPENIECYDSSKRLEELSNRVKNSMSIALGSGSQHDANDEALQKICDGCIEVSGELQRILEKLKIENDHAGRTRRKWNSFKDALKSVWSMHDIERLRSSLSAFRDELVLHLVLSIRDTTVSPTSEQKEKKFNEIQLSLKQLIAKPTVGNEDLLAQQRELIRANAAEHEKTRANILAALPKKDLLKVQDSMLHSLRFPQMHDRHEQIAEAHIETFKWVLEDSLVTTLQSSSLVNWLKSDKGVYWVSGKAGSGKSTLMRHIYDNPKTRIYLKIWSGDAELDVAGFFFWYSGNPHQRSHTGLLRSLLYEILAKKRHLLPEIFPLEWSEACHALSRTGSTAGNWELDNREWTLPALKRGLSRLADFDIMKSNLCFFIDGLDEYEGDHEDMVNRPWLVFEEIFEHGPLLRLQDLTASDIKLYVTHELEEHDRMRKLAKESLEHATELVNEIVSKAAGVFLWVKLAVRELLRGLRNRDGIQDLRTRLRAFPTELQNFYSHMLNQIEPIYQAQAAKTFHVFKAWKDHMASEGEGVCSIELEIAIFVTFDRMMETPYKTVSNDEVQQRTTHLDTHLKSRCAGLLEIYEHSNDEKDEERISQSRWSYSTVDYFHRTADEFLGGPHVKAMMLEWASTDPDFVPEFQILMSFVVRLKQHIFYHLEDDSRRRCEVFKLMRTALGFARKCDERQIATYDSTLVELDMVNQLLYTEMYKPSRIMGPKHWSEDVLWDRRTEQKGADLLGLALRENLINHVSRALMSKRDVFNAPSGLLQTLLNKPWQGSTPWQHCLRRTHEFDWKQREAEVSKVMENFTLCLEQGASPRTTCARTHNLQRNGKHVSCRGHTVTDVIIDCFQEDFPRETAELLELVKLQCKVWDKQKPSDNRSQNSDYYKSQTTRRLDIRKDIPRKRQRQY